MFYLWIQMFQLLYSLFLFSSDFRFCLSPFASLPLVSLFSSFIFLIVFFCPSSSSLYLSLASSVLSPSILPSHIISLLPSPSCFVFRLLAILHRQQTPVRSLGNSSPAGHQHIHFSCSISSPTERRASSSTITVTSQ